jgi:hypothetical protein
VAMRRWKSSAPVQSRKNSVILRLRNRPVTAAVPIAKDEREVVDLVCGSPCAVRRRIREEAKGNQVGCRLLSVTGTYGRRGVAVLLPDLCFHGRRAWSPHALLLSRDTHGTTHSVAASGGQRVELV